MDISARNIWERAFSIVVLFFAMVAFSSIVASITGSMTSLRNMKTEDMKQFWLLRRYLRQRAVSTELSDRIQKYLEHELLKQSKLVQRKRITVLQHLSNALQSELTHALNSPFLIEHPFFRYLDTNMSVVMHRLCHMCLKPQSHAEGEVVFSAGEKATRMYFIKGNSTGTSLSTVIEYTSVDGVKLHPPPMKGEWLSEAVLWTDWRHQGKLHSISTNDLIAVEPAPFSDVMCVHPRPWYFAKSYAANFLKFLNGLDEHEAIDIIRDDGFYKTAVESCDSKHHTNGEGHEHEDGVTTNGSPALTEDVQGAAHVPSPVKLGTSRMSEGGGGSRHRTTPSPRPGSRRLTWPCRGIMPCDPWSRGGYFQR
mmetsp:Transcript_70361/g.222284  ORF Transcript_70361/g.222284 Transcript_70361/m.222284 type:complete len:366 (-) Transcript_70361:241-1338(-)